MVPTLRGYRIRQEVLQLEDGATSHRLIKVPVNELTQWDDTHDAAGRQLSASSFTGSGKDQSADVVRELGSLEEKSSV